MPDDVAVCGFTLYPKGQAPNRGARIPRSDKREATPHRRGLFGWLRGHDRVS